MPHVHFLTQWQTTLELITAGQEDTDRQGSPVSVPLFCTLSRQTGGRNFSNFDIQYRWTGMLSEWSRSMIALPARGEKRIETSLIKPVLAEMQICLKCGMCPCVSICVYVCVQSPLVLCASHPNTTHGIPDILVGRNYSTLGTFTSLLMAYGGQMIRTKQGTEESRTPCTLCVADEHVHVIIQEM